jgi:hypothetical protein
MRARLTPELLAILAGVVFVLLGVLGFVPGITDHHEQLHFWKTHSRAELFGVFEVSVLLNAVHLGFGLFGLGWTRTPVNARLYLICGSIGGFTLAVYGVAIQHRSHGNFLPVNRADHWLHAGLGLGLLVLAWIAAHLHAEAPIPTSVPVHDGPRAALVELEQSLPEQHPAEPLPAVAWLASREISLDAAEVHGARRRAVLLLAAGWHSTAAR